MSLIPIFRRSCTFLLLLLAALPNLNGQGFEWTITAGSASYSEFGIDVDVDAYGNAYLGGEYYDGATIGDSTFSSQGDNDLFMARFDPYGEFVWATHFGSNQLDRVYAINASGESVFFTGYGKVAFPSKTSGVLHARDAIFGRLNAETGQLIWGKSLDGDVFSEGADVVGGEGEKCYAGGRMNSLTFLANDTLYGNGLKDGMVIKFGAQGDYIWGRNIGGANEDDLYALGKDRNENIVAGGFFTGSASAGPFTLSGSSGKDAYLTKMDSAGNFQWAISFNGNGDDQITALKVAPDGSIYFAGTFEFNLNVGGFPLVSSNSRDIFYGKADANGNVLWAEAAGGSSLDLAEDLDIDSDENVYLTGFFLGSFALQGTTATSAGVDDLWFCKLDSNGTLQNFVHSAYSDTRDAFGVAADDQGNALLSGTFIGLVDFGGDTIYSVNNSADIFLTKYSTLAPGVVIDSVSGLDQCVDTSFVIHYRFQGFFDDTNVLEAELSDAAGGFGNPFWVAMDTTGISGTLLASVPTSASNGNGYRVRLRTSNPVLTSADNGTDLTLETDLSPALVLSGDTVICGGNPAVVQISTSYSSQTWSNGGTGSISVYNTPGPAWVQATDASGCTRILYFEITECVSVPDPEKSSFAIYPNPGSRTFRIRWEEPLTEAAQFTLYDLSGQRLFEKTFDPLLGNDPVWLEVPELPEGLYLARVRGASWQATQALRIRHDR